MKDILRDIQPIRPPGTAFEYSSLNTQVLGFIVETVSGKPWNEVATEKIWSRIGMESDGLMGLSSAGEALHGGVFASRLRDKLRFGMIFTSSWDKISDHRIVSENYLDKVYKAADPSIYLKGFQGQRMTEDFGSNDAPKGAAYKWDAVFPDGDLFKAGLNGQGIYVSPATDTVVVYFATAWRNSLQMSPFARAIVKQHFR